MYPPCIWKAIGKDILSSLKRIALSHSPRQYTAGWPTPDVRLPHHVVCRQCLRAVGTKAAQHRGGGEGAPDATCLVATTGSTINSTRETTRDRIIERRGGSNNGLLVDRACAVERDGLQDMGKRQWGERCPGTGRIREERKEDSGGKGTICKGLAV